MTALMYVVIIVALLTHLTMSNINSLAQGFGKFYDPKKEKARRALDEARPKCILETRGQRFEAFRLKYENTKPSE